ncbi:hypothetical protein [Staphylococcus haemolyticus]|uniref:hypothetical protein n=1 Tax=Staphylococcus haemolyticus TaxID=1283 RepID=UPI001F0A9A56|nr:hypothetical protein [Staphylococcus haemolyticus]MCH4379945.1 hypothetical protein [Staphylococcus haemolyticus]
MKKLLGTLFAATLVLSACSQDDTKKDENKKSETATEKKSEDKKDKKTKEEKKSQENKDNSTEEQDTQETAINEQQPATQEQQQTQQANQQTQTNNNQQAQQTNNNQQQYSDEYLANNPVSTDGQLTPEEQQRYNEGMQENSQNSQNNHVDLNSLPATDFQTDWMSESGQEQVNDLAEQKDSGQISQYEFNDRVSDVMNNEMDNQ